MLGACRPLVSHLLLWVHPRGVHAIGHARVLLAIAIVSATGEKTKEVFKLSFVKKKFDTAVKIPQEL